MIILFIKTRIVIADVSGMNRVHIKEKAEHTCPKTFRFGLIIATAALSIPFKQLRTSGTGLGIISFLSENIGINF